MDIINMGMTEALLFADDSAFVKFQDGSYLQLSSCGAAVRCSPSDCRHAMYEKDTQQFTQYTTSLWKEKVQLAVNFRNKFAEFPYLCCHLLGKDVIQKKTVITPVCTWPSFNIKDHIIELEDGTLTMNSLEGNAAITLSTCQQTFTTKFLHQVSSVRREDPGKYHYAWVEHVYSVHGPYPCHLRHPLNVLNGTTARTDGKNICDVGEIPLCLPLHCKKPHMHRWKTRLIFRDNAVNDLMEIKSAKVIYSEGVIYRSFYQKYFIVEAFLSDGSFLRSEGPSHLYFKHWVYNVESHEVKENVYSVKALPLDKKDQLYSISRVVQTSVRYLSFLSHGGNDCGLFGCCWQNEDDPLSIHTLSDLKLEDSIYVPGLGAFKSFSNGRLHIVFCDGAIMDLFQPGEKECEKLAIFQHNLSKDSNRTSLVKNDVFNLILPNGISCNGSLKQPAAYKRYVEAALEFIGWKRWKTKKAKSLDDDKYSHCLAELEKIKKFNATLGHEPKSHLKPTDSCFQNVGTSTRIVDHACCTKSDDETYVDSLTCVDENHEQIAPAQSGIRNISKCLKDTRNSVDEIESVLKSCRRHLTNS